MKADSMHVYDGCRCRFRDARQLNKRKRTNPLCQGPNAVTQRNPCLKHCFASPAPMGGRVERKKGVEERGIEGKRFAQCKSTNSGRLHLATKDEKRGHVPICIQSSGSVKSQSLLSNHTRKQGLVRPVPVWRKCNQPIGWGSSQCFNQTCALGATHEHCSSDVEEIARSKSSLNRRKNLGALLEESKMAAMEGDNNFSEDRACVL